MQAGRKHPVEKEGARLSRERARAALLANLPNRACQIAAMVDNPAQINRSASLEELLSELTTLLQINVTVDMLMEARRQLEQLCEVAEQKQQTFEASIANLRERSAAKIHVKTLGASQEKADSRALERVHRVASEGGVFRQLAREGAALQLFLRNGEVCSELFGQQISATERACLQSLGAKIRLGRERIACELKNPLRPLGKTKVVRNLRRDVRRHQVISQIRLEASHEQRIKLLPSLFGDFSIEAVRFLIEMVLDSNQSAEIREMACCAVEYVAGKISLYDANELGRNLLARLTRFCVLHVFEPMEVLLLLRLFSSLGTVDGVAVLTQLIEDDNLRSVFKGSPEEQAILLLVLSLMSRGGTATRCLEKLVLGIGVEHLDEFANIRVRSAAAHALLAQNGGVKTLLQLLEFYIDEPVDSPIPKAIADALAQDDSSHKVKVLVEMFQEVSGSKQDSEANQMWRLVRALDGTLNPEATELLRKFASRRDLPAPLRSEAAVAVRAMRGAGLLQLLEDISRGTTTERAILLGALTGNSDESRLSVLADLFSREFEVLEGAPAIAEQQKLLQIAVNWELL